MNWRHLQAFLWLRWRLAANHWRRSGALNAALNTIFAVGVVVMAVPLFIGALLIGLFALADVEPAKLMYVWDGLVVVFSFFWVLGLMVELQRTDSLSLGKFMHLPVSVSGAFAINYVSSLLCLDLIVFVPIFFGLGLGLVFGRGWSLLPVLPLTAAFLLMVTALTYQFQGWLASLMSNPRLRRTIIVGATALFVLLFQLPNLVNVFRPWKIDSGAELIGKVTEENEAAQRAFEAHEIDVTQWQRRLEESSERYNEAMAKLNRDQAAEFDRIAGTVNYLLPIGWLPAGVRMAGDGRAGLALLPLAGMTVIGAASLWRAYRTTLAIYQGRDRVRRRRPALAPAASAAATTANAAATRPTKRPLEMRLPWVSEPVSAIALAGVRSLLRAPETKMLLLTPLIMGGVFGSMMLRSRAGMPEVVRPLAAIGTMVFSLLATGQLLGNQFGFDRDGFRVFVLSAVPRRDIVLGKNLAFAPLAAGISALIVIVFEVVNPMRVEHLLSMAPQFVSMYLLYCWLGNLMSILAPMHVAAGSLKPAKPKLTMVLLQMVMFMFLFPLSQAPTLLPLAVEAFLEWQGWSAGLPICLLLSLLECAAVVILYRLLLRAQGDLLQAREQRILEVVTGRAA